VLAASAATVIMVTVVVVIIHCVSKKCPKFDRL